MPKGPLDYTYAPGATIEVVGVKLPVAGFSLELVSTGIPKLVIQVDPFHQEGADVTQALAPQLGNFVRTWKRLQDALQGGNRELSFDFDAQKERADGAPENYDDLQKFKLDGWVMTAAGMRDVGPTGGFAVVIEAMHPAYQFQESTAFLQSTGKEVKIQPSEIAQTNVFEALISAMRAYHSVHEMGERIPELHGDDYEQVVQDFSTMIDNLEDYIVWDPDWSGGGIPAAGLWPKELEQVVLYSLVDYVRAASNSASWDRFIHSICAQWFLSLLPTFAEPKLRIRPLEPYQLHTMDLYDHDIVSMTLPAVDPAPIKGVMGTFSDLLTAGALSFGTTAEGERILHKDQVSVVEPTLSGKILNLQVPAWVSGAIDTAAAVRAGDFLPDEGENSKGEIPLSYGSEQNSSSSDTEPQEEVDVEDFKKIITDVLPAIGKELFLENFRNYYQVSLTTRLLIKTEDAQTPGGYLLPGFVARLQSTPENSDNAQALLDFYVIKVVHSVNCQQGKASTQILGSFIHDADKPTLAKFDMYDGVAYNALYNT